MAAHFERVDHAEAAAAAVLDIVAARGFFPALAFATQSAKLVLGYVVEVVMLGHIEIRWVRMRDVHHIEELMLLSTRIRSIVAVSGAVREFVRKLLEDFHNLVASMLAGPVIRAAYCMFGHFFELAGGYIPDAFRVQPFHVPVALVLYLSALPPFVWLPPVVLLHPFALRRLAALLLLFPASPSLHIHSLGRASPQTPVGCMKALPLEEAQLV